MKITKLLLTTLSIGVLTTLGAFAGTSSWCPKAPVEDCYVDDCPDIGGSISVGYGSDYIFYGTRFARDHVWADVNYTFDGILPINVGLLHISSLGSGGPGTDAYGDETNLYASVALPEFFGFNTSIGYAHYFFPTTRGPINANAGDSTAEVSLNISKDVMGFNLYYRGAYDFVAPGHLNNVNGIASFLEVPGNQDNGAWVHELGVGREICLTDNISLALNGGVYYVDNYWGDLVTASVINGNHSGRSSGWHAYYIKASLPIALNCRSTFTPYIGYNGTPDTWVGDELQGIDASNFNGRNQGANANDVFHWGVSLQVDF